MSHMTRNPEFSVLWGATVPVAWAPWQGPSWGVAMVSGHLCPARGALPGRPAGAHSIRGFAPPDFGHIFGSAEEFFEKMTSKNSFLVADTCGGATIAHPNQAGDIHHSICV